MRRPAFSVLIASRDRRGYLAETLASVEAQTFRDFEVVVCDDGSRDGTAAWLRRRRGVPVRLVRHARPLGPARARNAALALARGRFVAFLDSDDLWEPGYLAFQAGVLARRGVVASLTAWDVIDGAGVPRPEFIVEPVRPRPLFVRLTGLPSMPPFSILAARASALRAVGGFDERFAVFADDTDLVLRLGERYGRKAFAKSDEVLVHYRRHERGLSGTLRGLRANPFAGVPARVEEQDAQLAIDIILYARKHSLCES